MCIYLFTQNDLTALIMADIMHKGSKQFFTTVTKLHTNLTKYMNTMRMYNKHNCIDVLIS